MQVWREDMGVFINGSILDHPLSAFLQFSKLCKSRSQEKHLQIKGPTLHVLVEIVQIWVVIYLLKMRLVAVVFREESRERRFSRPNVSGYSNVHNLGFVQCAN